MPDHFFRPMQASDIDAIIRIESRAYAFGWNRNLFFSCLRDGYCNWVLAAHTVILGYGILSVAAGEAHVLNLCVAPEHQNRGYGRMLLTQLLASARDHATDRIFLEVRPSNPAAIHLYERFGFRQIGRRRAYYPAHGGREDALVMALDCAQTDGIQ